MVEGKFRSLHGVFKSYGGPHSSAVWKYVMPALIKFQFHMIARIDDTTQVIMDHIRVHDNFENALKTRLNWSKNVHDERDAPWQIILGSMDPVLCVLISLGLWLEFHLQIQLRWHRRMCLHSLMTSQYLAVDKRQRKLRRTYSEKGLEVARFPVRWSVGESQYSEVCFNSRSALWSLERRQGHQRPLERKGSSIGSIRRC